MVRTPSRSRASRCAGLRPRPNPKPDGIRELPPECRAGTTLPTASAVRRRRRRRRGQGCHGTTSRPTKPFGTKLSTRRQGTTWTTRQALLHAHRGQHSKLMAGTCSTIRTVTQAPHPQCPRSPGTLSAIGMGWVSAISGMRTLPASPGDLGRRPLIIPRWCLTASGPRQGCRRRIGLALD